LPYIFFDGCAPSAWTAIIKVTIHPSFLLARRSFFDAYLGEYLSRRPFPVEEIEAWVPVLAAARLCEHIAEEGAMLLRLADVAGIRF
jgi:hypothetical protein